MTEIYLVRHGESKGNLHFQTTGDSLAGIGVLGTDLTEQGKEQIKSTRERLKEIKFAAIYSSHLARAEESAMIFAEELKLPVNKTERLRERTMGSLQGKRSAELKETFKKEYEDLDKLSHEERMKWKLIPDMESANEAAERMKNILLEISQKHSGENILIVTHGALMRFFLMTLDFAKYDELSSGSIENGGYVKLSVDNDSFTITETYKVNKL